MGFAFEGFGMGVCRSFLSFFLNFFWVGYLLHLLVGAVVVVLLFVISRGM